MKQSVKTVLAVALLLTACDKDKIPLSGKRELFLNVTTNIVPDKEVKGKVVHLNGVSKMNKIVAVVDEIDFGVGESSAQRILSTPVVAGNMIYVMDSQGQVSAFERIAYPKKEGAAVKKVWSVESCEPQFKKEVLGGGVAIDDHVLFVSTSFGEMMALDVKDGKTLWKTAGFAPFRSMPYVDGKQVMAISVANELVVLNKTDGAKAWTHTGIPETAQLLSCAVPTAAYDAVIAGYSSGELYALNNVTGQVMWSDTITPVARIDTVTGIPHIAARPVVDGHNVYTLSHGGRMIAFDMKTGERIWQKEIGGVETPAVSGDYIFVVSGLSELICLEKQTGLVVWVKELKKLGEKDIYKTAHFKGPVVDGDHLWIAANNGDILRLNATNGEFISKVAVNAMPIAAPVLVDNVMYVGCSNAKIYALQ